MIKNKKFRKLLRDPKMFFRDYLGKRMPKYGLSFRFLKYSGNYNYTIISAVYNVEDYLDDYFTSIVNQTMNFRKNITIILVDDGSTDDSSSIIKNWQSKYPNNIIYIYKENGGQASARNIGIDYVINNNIQSDWISFIDPDDFIHRLYFYNIDKFICNRNDVKLVSTNIILFNEKNNSFLDKHPLRYNFTKGDLIKPWHNLDNRMQISVNSAIFSTNEIIYQDIHFDTSFLGNFVDVYFVNCYILNLNDGCVAFLSEPKYLSRHNSSSHYSILNSNFDIKNSISVIKYGYIELINKCIDKYGPIPTHYIQRTVIYSTIEIIKNLILIQSKLSIIDVSDCNDVIKLLVAVFDKIDYDIIINFNICGDFYKFGLLNLFKSINYKDIVINISLFDFNKSMLFISYYTASCSDSEVITIDSKVVDSSYDKVTQYSIIDHAFSTERRIWVPLPKNLGCQKLEVSVGGKKINLRLRGHQNSDPRFLYLFQIAAVFMPMISKISRPSPYTGGWILIDSKGQADDNAEHFYRYIQRNHPEQKCFFILNSTSHDWNRLLDDGFNLIPYGGKEMMKALSHGDKLISSHVHSEMILAFKKGGIDKKFIFLQHGVIKDDLSNWLNKYNIDFIVTTSQREYDSIVANFNRYKLTRKEVIITGLARHDALVGSRNQSPEPIILVAPTWRNYIVDPLLKTGIREKNDNFVNSLYFRAWESFLNNKDLIRLLNEHKFHVVFCPHPGVQQHKDDFSLPERVKIVGYDEGSIQNLFKKAMIMVTDYSSVAFDFSITGRPIIYYQFDQDEFFNKHMERGYFDYDRDGFGPVVIDECSLIYEIKKYILGYTDDIYESRRKDFFYYQDGKNCQRIYKAIIDENVC